MTRPTQALAPRTGRRADFTARRTALYNPAMIAQLHGRVAGLEADAVILDVGGVGYRVFVPVPLLAEIGPEGATVTLHTHLHVRENELALYGAGDEATLDLFPLLLTFSGLSPP